MRPHTPLTAALLLTATLATPALANTPVDIDRGGAELQDLLRHHPVDRDTTDTAIVASNGSGRAGSVVCFAFNANGERLGGGRMRVPANGVRFLRASDLANGTDYIGRVRCATGNPGISGAAFLVGTGGITDLKVKSRVHNGYEYFSVPVTASF